MADFVHMYVDIQDGNNLNDGLTPNTPKQTIASSLIAAESHGPYLVLHLMEGVYNEILIEVSVNSNLTRVSFVGEGDVRIKDTTIMLGKDLELFQMCNIGMRFNYPSYDSMVNTSDGDPNHDVLTKFSAIGCSFFGRSFADLWHLTRIKNTELRNCSVDNIRYLYEDADNDTNPKPDIKIHNSILVRTYKTNTSDSSRIKSYHCASDMTVWLNDVDTTAISNSNPPYYDGTSDPDPYFDKSSANYETYMTMGEDGSPVGRVDYLSTSFGKIGSSISAPFNMFYDKNAYDTYTGWDNDEEYFNTSLKQVNIVQDSNDKLTIEEGGTERTIVLTPASYSNTEINLFLNDVKSGLNNGSSIQYDVILIGNNKVQIIGDNVFTLKCSSTTDSAWSDLGFSETYDRAGVASAMSDFTMSVGSSDNSRTLCVIDGESKIIRPQWGAVLNSSVCGIRSDVIEYINKTKINRAAVGVIGSIQIDSDDSDSIYTLEARASNTAFLRYDNSSQVDMDWTEIEVNTDGPGIAGYYKYWQFAIKIRR